MDTWRYDIRTWYPAEAAPFLGNGFIGGNLPIDGHGAAGNRYPATVAAFYVGPEESFFKVPHWLNVPLTIDGRPARPSWVGFRQVLDLKTGIFSTSYTDASGSVRVQSETFCHRGRQEVAAYQLHVEALKDVSIELAPQLSLAPCRVRATTTRLAPDEATGAGWLLDYGDAGARAAQVMHLAFSGCGGSEALSGDEAIGRCHRARLAGGQGVQLRGIVATCTGGDPLPAAQRRSGEAAGEGYEALRQSHIDAMHQLWEGLDITVGDPFLGRRFKSSLFYLLSSYRREIVWGGTATGLSSQGSWGGSVFWDTEFYMLPPLLALHPDLARNMLMYRCRTLCGARQNACDHGEAGVRFAWQSKGSGRERADGGFESERHISSDIAYCADWYARSSGDEAFMRDWGRGLILEVARNWACRATWNPVHACYDISNIIPPDEHVWDHYRGTTVRNSAMTNGYARWVLQTAAELPGPEISNDERKAWRKIAEGIRLPRDERLGIYNEYEGYDGHPIKQADVGHLFFPLCISRDAEEIRRNVYYYADRERETGLYLTHSPSVYAAALSRAGDVRGVDRFLRLSERNVVGPFEIPRESNYGGGVVLTGAGSFLSVVLYGLLGLENNDEALSAHPCIPPEVGPITLAGVHFRGHRYRIQAGPGEGGCRIERR